MTDSTRTPRFAWCFSHGRHHCFWIGEEPWCTATWVWLDGASEEEALAHKAGVYGDARFLDQLEPPGRQLEVINASKEDQTRGEHDGWAAPAR